MSKFQFSTNGVMTQEQIDEFRRLFPGMDMTFTKLPDPTPKFIVPALVNIPEGDLTRDGKTTHIDEFEMGQFPITFDEYDLFCEETGRTPPSDEGWGRGRRPVINVTWHDAMAYCEWLSEKTGDTYDLPTAEEWEYACRGGTTTKFPWGDEFDGDYVHCDADQTIPVGSKRPTHWNLYDMLGQVWEWTKTLVS